MHSESESDSSDPSWGSKLDSVASVAVSFDDPESEGSITDSEVTAPPHPQLSRNIKHRAFIHSPAFQSMGLHTSKPNTLIRFQDHVRIDTRTIALSP
jgi:hypothetical protein